MTGNSATRLAIVIPVFNDWACVPPLLVAIGEAAQGLGRLSIFIIDDGSTAPAPPLTNPRPAGIGSIEVVRLVCNVGHQRAIAVGLCVVAERAAFDAVIVMDSDGEDRPEDIPLLVAQHRAHRGAGIVAQRRKRSERWGFRILYALYKLLFRILTGRVIDFGNFCLISGEQLERQVHMRETWSHLGASLLRAPVPVVKVPTVRGQRYVGTSSMNLFSLILHGFSAISVFIDTVFLRLMLLCGGLVLVATALALVATFLRLFTEAAIPGWATSVVGFAMLMIFQALTLLMIAVIMLLSSRSALPLIPARQARLFIKDERVVGQP